jgi:hypothetical protein
MAQAIQPPWNKVILASTALISTSSTSAFAMPVTSGSFSIGITVSAASGTSPTADFVLQTSYDAGTTYVDLPLRWTQFNAAAGPRWLIFRNGLGNNEVALEQVAADTGGTLAKNCNFDPRYMKIKYTIAGTSPSFTTVIIAFANNQGVGAAL